MKEPNFISITGWYDWFREIQEMSQEYWKYARFLLTGGKYVFYLFRRLITFFFQIWPVFCLSFQMKLIVPKWNFVLNPAGGLSLQPDQVNIFTPN